jgi:hypothetical protein
MPMRVVVLIEEAIVKKLLMLTLVLGIVPVAMGQITLEVYQADGETPFDCNDDIMVGTKLTLIVSSDPNNYWSGGLFIAGQDRALGTLAGRDKDPNTRDWTGSHYESAGDFAQVWAWQDSSIWGFDLYTFYPVDGNSDSNTTVAGEWFVIDYYADEVGDCNVGFYDYSNSIGWVDPNYYITFSHIPTRDLNSDEVVNFEDFAIFASQWSAIDCDDPNWCEGADLDRNDEVDYNDLGFFVEYWLWSASANEPYPGDPNIIYSIVDVNGSNDITIDVNDSVTLYVTKETNDVNIFIFHFEVDISDTNLGSIDNTEYPNGTAQILASPRDSFFDYWGPGLEQEEGIEVFAISILSPPISDGDLASFVFTCEGEGDVTLELLNWDSSITPTLESIIIHQVEPNSQQMMGMGGGMEEMLDTEEIQQPQPTQQEIDEMVSWLEELWLQEEQIRETYSEADWNEFIEAVKNSYP